MAKVINLDSCLICADRDGSIVLVLLAASASTDVTDSFASLTHFNAINTSTVSSPTITSNAATFSPELFDLFGSSSSQPFNTMTSASLQSNVMGMQPNMMVSQPGMMGIQAGIMGSPPGMMGGQPGMMGGYPGMMGLQAGMMGSQPVMMGSQPGMMAGQPGMMGSQPNLMGGQARVMGMAPTSLPGMQTPMMMQTGFMLSASQQPMIGAEMGHISAAGFPLQPTSASFIPLEKTHLKDLLVDIGESWWKALEPEFRKDYFIKLSKFVESERRNGTVYPPAKDVFAFTRVCDIKDVNVIIVGQDPYCELNKAHGLAFSVRKGVPTPRSLQNIYLELKQDIRDFQVPSHGYLMGWAEQGVLLLNACLTVRAHEANSHKDRGWEKFTDAIISWFNKNCYRIVFILWGKDAQEKEALIDQERHYILKAAHPSPLSAYKGFFGCKHFSMCNEQLIAYEKTQINWSHLP